MKKRLKLKVIATAAVSAGVVSLAAVSLAQAEHTPRDAMQQEGIRLLDAALTAGCLQVTTDTEARQTVDTTFQAALNSRCSVAQ